MHQGHSIAGFGVIFSYMLIFVLFYVIILRKSNLKYFAAFRYISQHFASLKVFAPDPGKKDTQSNNFLKLNRPEKCTKYI